MFGWCRILSFFSIQLFFTTTTSITVEKNYYLYYKLPTEITADNSTENFFLLQCPYRATIEIPLLKEMSSCRILARYGDVKHPILSPGAKVSYNKPNNHLHTRITYKIPKVPKTTKMINDMRPYLHKVIIRPMIQMPLGTAKRGNNFALSTMPMSSVLPLTMSPDVIRKPRAEVKAIIPTLPPSTLRYLNAQDTINNLFQDQYTPEATELNDNNEHNQLQRLFTKHSKFKNGEKATGYRNMYYRDEIVNDHIFYSDQDQNGNYQLHGNVD